MNEHKTPPSQKPGKPLLNSSLLMREIAKMAGIEMGLFQKMTLHLVAGEPPIIVTEGFLPEPSPEPEQDNDNKEAHATHTTTSGRWFETKLPLESSLPPATPSSRVLAEEIEKAKKEWIKRVARGQPL